MLSEDVNRFDETLLNIGTYLQRLPSQERRVVRNIEATQKKHVNAKYAVLFNEFCILNNLLSSFTNINLQDRAVQQSELTRDFRRKLLETETEKKKRLLDDLSHQVSEAITQFSSSNTDEDLRASTLAKVSDIVLDYEETVKTRTHRKLSLLYGDHVVLPDSSDNFINLSSHELTSDQKELLNLGLNCTFYPKHNQEGKKAELELLYQQICDHSQAGRINVNPDVQEQLLAEGTKRRGSNKSRLITPRLREAAKELRNNKNLIIRRADKSSVFVLLNRSEYLSKVNAILEDATKF